MEINERFGREVFPPSMIVPKLNITGKGEIIPFLQQQEQQSQAVQGEAQNIQHAFEEMKMKELLAKIHNQLSMARERDARSESNVGLFEERMSEISKNHSLAMKEKMEALTKLLEAVQKYGEIETMLKSNQLESVTMDDEEYEKNARIGIEKQEAAKKFYQQLMALQPEQIPKEQPEQKAM
jgi:hypothetical protein